MPQTNVIKVKRTTVPSKVPTTSDIVAGELAANLIDKILYTRDTSNNIISLTGVVSNIAGTGISLSGTNNVTISIDSTVATLTGSQTLTNKTISGSNNTISNIGNSSLTNSSITINGTTVSLGGTATITASAGGSNTQVQYNSSNVLAGSANLTFDGTRLTAAALTVDTNTLYVDATNDRVGIGTSSPGAKLTVVSGDSATATNQVIVSGGRSLGGGVFGSAGSILFTNSYWNSGFGAAMISASDSGSVGGHLAFATLADSGGVSGTPTEKMRILQNGNVGIGTTSPGYTLDVKGSGVVAVRLTNAGASDNVQLRFRGNQTNAEQWAIGNEVATGGTGTNFDIYDLVSSSNRVRIAGSGNVGIGLTSPATILDVGYTTATDGFISFTSGSLSRIRLGYQSSATPTSNVIQAQIFADSVGNLNISSRTNNASGIIFYTNSATTASERMRIDSSGNVLVGTTSSGFNAAGLPLVVGFGSGNTGITIFSGSTTSGSIHFADTVTTGGGSYSGYINYNHNTNSMQFGTDALERMRIDSSGNVGIGTASPKQKLHVSGQGLFTSSAAGYDPGDSAGPAVRVGYSSSDYGYVISNETGIANKRLLLGGLQIEYLINGTEKMRIDYGGNVGIGTSSPAYQLQLSTDSAAKPTTNTWTIASDARLKAVKGEYQKGLAEICQVRPVSYEYNGRAGFVPDGKDKVSILAQEIMQVFPECVDTFKGKLEEDGPEIDLYNYNGHAITFALINAIKELKAEIDILKARN